MNSNFDVIIVGSGPGGAFLGYLLAKKGIKVVVLEKSTSLERDFRGETIAPGSVYLLKKLGILDDIPEENYLKVRNLLMFDKNSKLLSLQFKNFKHPQKFGIDIPQPTVLNAIINKSLQYDNYTYLNGTKCYDLVENDLRQVIGVKCKTSNGKSFTLKSSLVVGADGRFSKVRDLSKLPFTKTEYDRDLIWFKVPRPKSWTDANIIKVEKNDHLIILPTHPDLLRIGTYIQNNGWAEARNQGLNDFKKKVIQLEPSLEYEINTHISSWKDTTLLKIFSTYSPNWSRDGLILIGDAAHTLSPILGQGVNVAMQDSYSLSTYIIRAINRRKNKESVVKKIELIDFEKNRKNEVSYIKSFQDKQEKSLAAASNISCLLRKYKMKLLNKHPLKYYIMSKLQYGDLYREKP